MKWRHCNCPHPLSIPTVAPPRLGLGRRVQKLPPWVLPRLASPLALRSVARGVGAGQAGRRHGAAWRRWVGAGGGGGLRSWHVRAARSAGLFAWFLPHPSVVAVAWRGGGWRERQRGEARRGAAAAPPHSASQSRGADATVPARVRPHPARRQARRRIGVAFEPRPRCVTPPAATRPRPPGGRGAVAVAFAAQEPA